MNLDKHTAPVAVPLGYVLPEVVTSIDPAISVSQYQRCMICTYKSQDNRERMQVCSIFKMFIISQYSCF